MYGVTTDIMFKSGLTFGKEIFTATICKDMRCAALKASVTKLCRHVQILSLNIFWTKSWWSDECWRGGSDVDTVSHWFNDDKQCLQCAEMLELVDAGGLIWCMTLQGVVYTPHSNCTRSQSIQWTTPQLKLININLNLLPILYLAKRFAC